MKKHILIIFAAAALATAACAKADAPADEITETTTEQIAEATKETNNNISFNISSELFEKTGEGQNEIYYGSDNGNIVIAEKTEEEDSIYATLPETEEQVTALFNGLEGSFDIKEFSLEQEGEAKIYKVVVDIRNLRTPNSSEDEGASYIMVEYINSTPQGYKDAYAEIYNTDVLIDVKKAFSKYIEG